jgi:hypothetical protein
MRTVICHFFNEEYLLPWWLKHHRGQFDYGILIDHGSTDSSADICRELAPDWRLVRSRLTRFDAYMTDFEVMEYERGLPGWKIALNVTEFLMSTAPLSVLEEYLVQNNRTGCAATGMLMVDDQPYTPRDHNIPLPLQCHFGVDDNTIVDPAQRKALNILAVPQRNRFYHRNEVGMYHPGRHLTFNPDGQFRMADLMVFHYGYAPWNEQVLRRKIQVGTKIHPEDVNRGWGLHHLRGAEHLQLDYLKIKQAAIDLRTHGFASRAIDASCKY